MPSQRKTRNLKLSQWQGNEFVSFRDIAEDNEKIDNKIGMIDMALQGKVNTSDIQGILGSVDISSKVDKIQGKGLSTNDYTNADKQKVNNLPVNINAELNKKVTIVSGKGLSTNDFSDDYKRKVDGIDGTIDNKFQEASVVWLAALNSKVSNVDFNAEIESLKKSVVSGKQSIATAINDINGTTVARSSMTHGDLANAVRNLFPRNQDNIVNNKANMTARSSYGTSNTDYSITFSLNTSSGGIIAYGSGYGSNSNNRVTLEKGIYLIRDINYMNIISGSVGKITNNYDYNSGWIMGVIIVFSKSVFSCNTSNRFVSFFKL